MIKSRLIRIILILVLAGLLIAGALGAFYSAGNSAENKENLNDTENSEALEPDEETILYTANADKLSQAMNKALSEGGRDFFAGYPVDETFLSYISAEYGDDILYDIASGAHEADPSLWNRLTGRSIHVLWAEFCRDKNVYTYMLSNVHWRDSADQSAVVIDVIGDINFDENWYTMQKAATLPKGVYDCFSEDIKSELTSADLAVVNNEFTYGSVGEALPDKDYVFNTPEDSVAYLDMFGTDIVSLANNHTYDMGEKGLLNTISVLKEAGYDTVGAGFNLSEASAAQYYIINGMKIGIISMTEIERFSDFTKAATDTSAGVFKSQDREYLISAVKKAKSRCDYLIALTHWGTEGITGVSEDQIYLSGALSLNGADAIIGGHSHRLQGAQFKNGVPIIYGMGNFWFSTGDLFTTIAQVQISNDEGLRVKMIPVRQQDLMTSIITEENMLKRYFEYVTDASYSVGMDENGYIYDISSNGQPNDPNIKYRSGMQYRRHNFNYDLVGNRIDQVGNLE